ncbi:MAG: hypothetical protein E7037_00680 [Verrucomicrobia bacterium]|nr:hypothetical protein [Verrucomicrobiota bacterium]
MRLKDNSLHTLSANDKRYCLPDLEAISGRTIESLISENPKLLVFPQSFEKSQDKLSANMILTFERATSKIRTGNLMGFIGIRKTQVEICSRFESDLGNDFFLHYLLQKVFSLNLFSWKHESKQDSVLDILALIFPHFLKKALFQGVYKEYRTQKYNDANIRGGIDFARHIRTNIPFCGRIAYRTREYSSENALSHLIRHTIEYLRGDKIFASLLHFDKETEDAVSKIVAATPSFNPAEQERVIAKNLRPRVHPLFSEYGPLQKICIQILRHDSLKYGNTKDEISGVLFDGAWLWEEYLATLPALKDFSHPKNKTGAGRKYIFSDKRGYCYPDFYNHLCVLDAKYKDKPSVDSSRPDTFQIISYLHILNVRKGGFISPSTRCAFDWVTSKRELSGIGGALASFHLEIPQHTAEYAEFCREIKRSENELSQKIQQFLET